MLLRSGIIFIRKVVIIIATTTITFRIDEELKGELQTLVGKLGLDITTYFTMAAKQAVMEQGLPFQSKVKSNYDIRDYILAMQNTKYNKNGKAILSKGDEWEDETEWDEMFEQIKKENK